MIAGRGDGIDLISPERWVIQSLKDPSVFFRHLHLILPAGSNLYFEGADIAPELAVFYQQNRAADAVSVIRDMIFPIPETFHLKVTPLVLEKLPELISKFSLEKCFYHLKGYQGETLLFSFHDAFDGSPLLLSDQIPPEKIKLFSDACAAPFHREPNINKRDPQQLERILWALENPDKMKLRRPWWQRLLFWRT